jgi:hypothetical protein
MTDLSCLDDRRRQLIRAKGLNGVDYVDVDPDQRSLTVYFLAKAPPDVKPANVRIEGGRRITGITVLDVQMCRVADPDLDDCMVVKVDRSGDFSRYRLCLVDAGEDGRPGRTPMAGLDRRYACAEFSFKVACPSSFDCAPVDDCPPPVVVEPELNYLAKDYASFRQLMLDRLSLVMPDWQERHEADLGIALVEVLAYTGDYLSYYQDAVATEAYLDTARLRTSVRRHARLVDYVMHEGCNARAWVCVETDADVTLPPDVAFVTAGGGSGQHETFLPMEPAETAVYVAHNRMHVYTWGDAECCLPQGATSATLLDRCVECRPATEEEEEGYEGPPRALHVRAGDVVILEEVLGPSTGDPADADPRRRHAVRLTKVTPLEDTVTDELLVEVEWGADDALPFPLCISTTGPPPECEMLENVSVARGNVMLVDHGRRVLSEVIGTVGVRSTWVPCDDAACGESTRFTPERFRPQLAEQLLTFRERLPAAASAAALMRPQDPRRARAQLDLTHIPLAPGGAVTLFSPSDFEFPEALVLRLLDPDDPTAQALLVRLAAGTRHLLESEDPDAEISSALRVALGEDLARLRERWTVQPDLLRSGPDDCHVVVEVDNDGVAGLRFGDGNLGRQPAAHATFMADYRVGNGAAGNVGPETITRIVFGASVVHNVVLRPRNPLAAWGGTPAEPMADVKLRAPGSFRRDLARAVTADDYARLAERHPHVQRAAAARRWTGSWIEVRVALDPKGGTFDDALQSDVLRILDGYRRIGHDIVVVPATYVPLHVSLVVCVLPSYLRGHVEADVRRELGRSRLADGRLGFFHPDRLTFGDDIHLSRLVAAAQAVPGVESVKLLAMERLHGPPGREIDEGVLRLGGLEIAQLDNDPDFPENGVLELTIEGGR